MARPRTLDASIATVALLITGCACPPPPSNQPRSTTTAAVAPAPADPPPAPAPYQLICPNTVEADCAPARRAIDKALTSLAAEFADLGGMRLIDGADIRIALDPLPHRAPRFDIESGVEGGRYYGLVTLQAPSRLAPTGRSAVGEPLDINYFEKNTAHELSTIFLERATRNRGTGWRFFSAPPWFVQGFEDYLGLMCSTKHARTVTLPKYVALVKENPSRVGPGMTAKDPYRDGAVLLLFLHRAFGKERVHAILANGAATFDEALQTTLGVTKSDLLDRFGKWLDAP